MATIVSMHAYASTNDASSYTTGSFSSLYDDLLGAVVTASDTGAPVALSAGTVGPFLLVATVASAPGIKSYLFVSEATSSGGSQTATFTCTGDPATGCAINVFAIRGLDPGVAGARAVRQWAKTEGNTSGTPAVILGSTPLADGPVVGAVSNLTYRALVSPPSGWSDVTGGGNGFNSPTAGQIVSYKSSAVGSPNVTWGSASTFFGAIAAEFSVSGLVTTNGSLAVTESGSDTASAAGSVVVSATMSAVESGSDMVRFKAPNRPGPTKTQGTELYLIDPDTGALLVPGCITVIEGVGSDVEADDVTCLRDSSRRYEAGLATPGAVTFGIYIDPDDANHVRLYEVKLSGATCRWAIGWSDGSEAPAVDGGAFELPLSRTWLEFEGHMTAYPFSFAAAAVVQSTISIQVTSDPQLTQRV